MYFFYIFLKKYFRLVKFAVCLEKIVNFVVKKYRLFHFLRYIYVNNTAFLSAALVVVSFFVFDYFEVEDGECYAKGKEKNNFLFI